ncbi:MAG TPA: C10 family peptidase [Bacteroidales bacterium]|nr:C10 family peptidase [Bacteroidales bacterium]HSA43289.1 C10 family peptidase [Bacteroidales bacterium]
MHRTTSLLVCLLLVIKAFAGSIDQKQAENQAAAFIRLHNVSQSNRIVHTDKLTSPDDKAIGYLFTLSPHGFVVISGDDRLPPVIAYSFDNEPDDQGRFRGLLIKDLGNRIANLKLESGEHKEENRQAWKEIIQHQLHDRIFQQWPPAGSTTTGGWLETNWTQNAPYNALCPMDPVTGNRSIAGCPAVAMAQILNYHHTTNSVAFSDADDYFHNYAGRSYWIDDDADSLDFPDFPDLNSLIWNLSQDYLSGNPLSNSAKASLVFACGVAAKQVFTSAASGTFGVSQAMAAYQKFNFTQCELLDDSDTSLYTRIAQNMMDSMPVHLAVVNQNWTSGHNVVVDGYNTDGYFHLNFGWGGQANAWYLLPSQIPYGLTVIEGAIVDIIPNTLTAAVSPIPAAFRLYPNPAADMVRIDLNEGQEAIMKMFDANGRLVMSGQLMQSTTNISLRGFGEGVYQVVVTGPGGITSRKLLIGMSSQR